MPKISPRPAAPAVYSAQQVQTIFATAAALCDKQHQAITDLQKIIADQAHILMQYRGLTALARSGGRL